MTTSRCDFLYVDAQGKEISPSSFTSPVQMIEGVPEPSPGGRSIDTVAWQTVRIIFHSTAGGIDVSGTMWNWRFSLDGVNWGALFPQVLGTVVAREMRLDHVFSFPVDRVLSIEPYVVAWGVGATGAEIDILISMS